MQRTTINSIGCWTLIDTFTQLSEANRQAMKDELDEGIQCPNTTHIDVKGNSLTQGGAKFEVTVKPSAYGLAQGILDQINTVMSTAITRYFEPDEYRE